MAKAQGCYASSEIRLRDALNARREHLQFKPGLVDAVFTAGAAYREWRDKDRRLLAAVEDRGRELKLATFRRKIAFFDQLWHDVEGSNRV